MSSKLKECWQTGSCSWIITPTHRNNNTPTTWSVQDTSDGTGSEPLTVSRLLIPLCRRTNSETTLSRKDAWRILKVCRRAHFSFLFLFFSFYTQISSSSSFLHYSFSNTEPDVSFQLSPPPALLVVLCLNRQPHFRSCWLLPRQQTW